MEAWEFDGYSALLVSILKDLSIEKAFKEVRGYGFSKGISKRKVRKWTNREVTLVIEMIKDHNDIKDIAKIIKRDNKSVSQKIYNLKMKGIL